MVKNTVTLYLNDASSIPIRITSKNTFLWVSTVEYSLLSQKAQGETGKVGPLKLFRTVGKLTININLLIYCVGRLVITNQIYFTKPRGNGEQTGPLESLLNFSKIDKHYEFFQLFASGYFQHQIHCIGISQDGRDRRAKWAL